METHTHLFEDEDVKTEAFASEPFEIPSGYVPEVLPSTGEKLTVAIDKAHAYPILDTLLDAYTNNLPPYNLERARVPHDPRHMPQTLERGTVDHAMFLFNICYYMRGGKKSNDAVKQMGRVYDDHPELFNADYARLVDAGDIEAILQENGFGFQRTVAKQWVENSQRLHEQYGGDPRMIFSGIDTYEQSQKRIQNKRGQGFIGFQEKMTSMLIYYLMDEGLIDPFNFPIPVDFHVMRVSIANEMIKFSDSNGNMPPFGTNLFTDETKAALRKLYLDYVEEQGVSPLDLCSAVWMLSESSCGKHPGNTTIEPFGRKVRNGRNTYLLPRVVDTHDPSQQKMYAESCGICPIQETCEYNIPGTQYYVGGSIIIRGRRVRFPIIQQAPALFDM